MLVDLEIPQGATMLVVHRQDGTMTVSVERPVFERAYAIMKETLAVPSRRYAAAAVARDLEQIV